MKCFSSRAFAPALVLATLAVAQGAPAFAADSSSSSSELEALISRARADGQKKGVPEAVLLEMEDQLRKTPIPSTGSESTEVPVSVQELCSDPNFVGQQVCFDGTDSYTPDGSAIALVYWGFGEGSYFLGAPAKVYHTYSMPATYKVYLQVMNAAGIWGDQQTISLPLDYRPPTPCYTVQSSNLNGSLARVVLDGTCSQAYDAQSISVYRWDYCVTVRGSGQECSSSSANSIAIDVLRTSSSRLSGTLRVRDTRGKESEMQFRTTLSSGN